MPLTPIELDFLDTLTRAVRSAMHRTLFYDLEHRLKRIKIANGVWPEKLPGELQDQYETRVERMLDSHRPAPIVPSGDRPADETPWAQYAMRGARRMAPVVPSGDELLDEAFGHIERDLV